MVERPALSGANYFVSMKKILIIFFQNMGFKEETNSSIAAKKERVYLISF